MALAALARALSSSYAQTLRVSASRLAVEPGPMLHTRTYSTGDKPGDSANSEATDASAAASPPEPGLESLEPPQDDMARLVVFGGNGFVGSAVCKAALAAGLQVVSVSRSGAPPRGGGSWVEDVEWHRGDAMEAAGWRGQVEGALGVVSCIGAFGSNEFMLKVNGAANVSIIEEAAAAGVPRMAYISAHEFGFPDFVLRGYFQGKRAAERALFDALPFGGVALRPGFIYGTRQVGGVGLPLGLVGSPLEAALKVMPSRTLAGIPLLGAAFVPPVSVDAVGKAAVAAATDPAVPAGPMDVWTIQKYS